MESEKYFDEKFSAQIKYIFKSNDMLESNDENKNGCNNSYKTPLPPIVYQSDNDKEAYMKNRKEQMRLIKILDHLKIQVQVYGQLFQKEKQVSQSDFELKLFKRYIPL